MHLNIFRVIWGDRKTANFDEHMTVLCSMGIFAKSENTTNTPNSVY
jgi:hypothetical protein